ncbi:tubulin alpha chain-like [Pyrus ussuriensis x Pyrus communis]|uniref:Tubulin alpha chain-like n=1 Tax=Pyrus ussuriensis x Pyrus communis TaxID=2448454 RepID=A0A5N5G748_9ROSA|nr:tubulin alpha chain-like [Pyrus ussuriensis x Pyrus communis]
MLKCPLKSQRKDGHLAAAAKPKPNGASEELIVDILKQLPPKSLPEFRPSSSEEKPSHVPIRAGNQHPCDFVALLRHPFVDEVHTGTYRQLFHPEQLQVA